MTRRANGQSMSDFEEGKGVVLRKRRDEKPDPLVRAFCALTLEPEAIETLINALRPVTLQLNRANWVDPAKWHVTVKFFGEIPESTLDELGNCMQVECGERITVSLRGVGAFPDLREPQVVWVGVRETGDGLKLLHRRLNDASARLGHESDNRKYRPHITVARIRQSKAFPIARELTPVLDTAFVEAELKTLTLFRSDMGPDGSIYTALRTVTLATASRRRDLTPNE